MSQLIEVAPGVYEPGLAGARLDEFQAHKAAVVVAPDLRMGETLIGEVISVAPLDGARLTGLQGRTLSVNSYDQFLEQLGSALEGPWWKPAMHDDCEFRGQLRVAQVLIDKLHAKIFPNVTTLDLGNEFLQALHEDLGGSREVAINRLGKYCTQVLGRLWVVDISNVVPPKEQVTMRLPIAELCGVVTDPSSYVRPNDSSEDVSNHPRLGAAVLDKKGQLALMPGSSLRIFALLEGGAL